ncbi:glucose 1-dehydrogenase [SAR202 cluster bacterium AC-647-P02_OGT_505m]|nr:glucose 1-dehydrogenase [SAR202 cluster bacterium AC-647-P02_OGT_505m]
MSSRLKNKVAIITGAAKGQGEFEARLFASEGATVVLCDIDVEACGKTAEEISSSGGSAVSMTLDVTSEPNWIGVVEQTVEFFGKLDILVNNAGIYSRVPIENASVEEFDHILEVNLRGVFLGTKHAIPAMRTSGGGSIINISSTAGIVGNVGSGAYGASKGGVRSFTKYTAIQHASEGIRANSVHPGPIDTDMISDNLSTAEGRKSTESRIPMGRVGSIEDVAMGVLFLATDESSYMTGSELVIDGGMTAQ